MGTRVVQSREAGLRDDAESRPDQDREGQDQHGEHRELHFVSLDLLAEVLGRAPDHEPGDEHGEDDEKKHPVEPRAHAPEDDLAELDVQERNEAAERREGVVHRVDRAAGGIRRDRREKGGVDGPEPDLFAFHVSHRGRDAEPVMDRVPAHLEVARGQSAPTRKSVAIDQNTAHPWRVLPVIEPSVYVRPAPTEKMRNISTRLLNGVGFS